MPPMTAPPTTAAAPVEAQIDPAIEKSLMQTMQGLGALYMACHKSDPESPLCDAIMTIQKAVAEIGRTAGSPEDPSMMMDQSGGDPMADPMAAEQDPMAAGGDPAAMMGAEPPMEEGAPPASIADAAGDTQMMMQDAAKRRLANG